MLTLLSLLLTAAADPVRQPVRLNGASAAELDAIDGIDTPTADRIVALRTERGRLQSVEALRILGLPDATLDVLRNNVAVDLPMPSEQMDAQLTTVDEVLGQFASEPEIRSVQAMATSYTKSNPELVEAWLRASKQAYLLPKVNLKYKKDLDQGDDYTYTADGDEELTGTDIDNDDEYEVKLEWRLDKLVMSSERIRVINEAQDLVKLRDKVLEEVTRLYFDRRRLQVELLLKPPADLAGRVKSELELQELTADLDAFTGGQFSAALPK